MECPAPVKQAMRRINLDVALPQDEKLVSAWLDWVIAQQMMPEDKWPSETPAKRRRNLGAELQLYTAR